MALVEACAELASGGKSEPLRGSLTTADVTFLDEQAPYVEAVTVAGKKGVQLTYSDPLEMVCQVAEKTGGNRSSMLQDFDRRRPSEIDFINGAIVREAEALGLEVPVNRAVTRLVRVLDLIHAEQHRTDGEA